MNNILIQVLPCGPSPDCHGEETYFSHAWGLSRKIPETLRVPPHTVSCEHSIALTSKQIGRLGRQGVTDTVHGAPLPFVSLIFEDGTLVVLLTS